ncbi:hypothetical protein ACTXHP_10635 [Bacillus stercoris]|uniref:hypothetical protein n=1 Tax=Bacillus stercoris TaxID=2054641 RepID=UPI00404545DD
MIAHDSQTGGKRPLSYSQYAFTKSHFSPGIFSRASRMTSSAPQSQLTPVLTSNQASS